jgi:tetratricopeptide (TPR) repeat protein
MLACVCVTASAQATRQLERERTGAPAASQKRLALVIGNGGYKFVGPLANPVNDASDMAAALRKLGFEVISGTDQNKRQMETLIRQFGERLSETKAVGLFYYAGHGFQSAGQNFLAPVDADIPAEDEIEYSAVNLNFVLGKMAVAGNPLNIVILDACRNNPFAKKWRSVRDISTQGGLAGITKAPTGTMIAYSTAPGEVASDGGGRNGLYTGELLKQIAKPDTSLEDVFKNVRAEVRRKSESKQVPWESSSVEGNFYFAGDLGASGNIVSKPASVGGGSAPIPARSTANLSQVERWMKMARDNDDERLVAETTAEIKAHPENFAAYWLRTIAVDSAQELGRDEQDARTVLKLLSAPKTAEEFTARCSVQMFLPKADREKQDWCTKAIELDPKYALAYYYRANAYEASERARKILDYSKAIELDPQNPLYYIARGWIFVNAGENASGLSDLIKATQVDPSRPYSYFQLADYHERQRDDDNAQANYDKAVEVGPKSADAFIERAGFYQRKDQLLTSDLDFYKAVELAPKRSSEFYNVRARWYSSGTKPNYDKALADINKAIEADPARYISVRANIYYNKGDYQNAVDDYTRAISLNPKNHGSYISRGNTYAKLNDMPKALADFDKYAELEPQSTSPFTARGRLYKEQGDFAKAVEEYSKAIQISPNASVYFGRGQVYVADKKWDQAISDFSKAIQLAPNSAGYYNWRGIAYSWKPDMDMAIADYTKAIEIDPKYVNAYENRAKAYQGKNDALAEADRQKAKELKSKP